MLQIRRVLHPTDFADGSRAALAHAVLLARRHGAHLHVVHAATLPGAVPGAGWVDAPPLDPAVWEAARTETEAALRAYVRAGVPEDVAVTTAVRVGSAVAVVLEEAEATGSDLVVMGTHGRHGLRRLVLGSVAEAVTRRASCPVLTVRERPEGTGRGSHESGPLVRRVLAPIDLAFFAEDLAWYAAHVARAYGADLELLHVVDAVLDPSLVGLGLGDRALRLAALEADAHERLAALAATVAAEAGGVVRCRVETGLPREAVPAAAAHVADLVVTASHGVTVIDRFLFGSVAAAAVREAPGAALVVKPFGRSLLSARLASSPAGHCA